ncbi:hypothetical protein [Pseudomonas gorinensis]
MDQWRCDSCRSTRPLRKLQTPVHPHAARTVTDHRHPNSPITRTTLGTARSRRARVITRIDRNLPSRKTLGIARYPHAQATTGNLRKTTGNARRTTAATARSRHIRGTIRIDRNLHSRKTLGIARHPHAQATTGNLRKTTGNARRTTAATARSRHIRGTIRIDRNLHSRKTLGIARYPHAQATTGNLRKTTGNARRTTAATARPCMAIQLKTSNHTPPRNINRPIPNQRMMAITFNWYWPKTKQ